MRIVSLGLLCVGLGLLPPRPACADVSDSGSLTIGAQGVIQGTMTVQGNAFSVGGSTVVVKSGNVGIGTTSPSTLLEVLGGVMKSTGAGGGGRFSNPTDQRFVLRVGDRTSATSPGGPRSLDIGNSSSDGTGTMEIQAFNVGSVDNLLLQRQGGNVGIGTTSPTQGLFVSSGSSNSYLNTGNFLNKSNGTSAIDRICLGTDASDCSGQFAAFGSQYSGQPNEVNIQNANNYPLTFGTNATTRMTILGNGNVGIGATNPSTTLQVVQNGLIVRFSSGTGVGQDIGDITYGDATPTSFELVSRPGHDIAFLPGTVATMTLKTGGNVGIGTTSPAGTLDVNGSAYLRGTGSPSTGKALCINSSQQLSYCTSAVDSSGNCTCH